MKKRKAKKTLLNCFRFLARIFVLNIPILALLIALLVTQQVTFWVAFSCFWIIFIVISLWTAYVFHQWESFIAYLKTLAQGIDADLPRVHKGIFGSFRLANAFLSVKRVWSSQTLSAGHILDNLPDPLLMINNSNEIVFANKIALNFFGESLINQPITTIFKTPSFQTALRQLSLGKHKHEWFEWDFQEDGYYSFQVQLEQLPAPAKNTGTVVIVLHDITQLKLFKQQQADFFANASHELKTPLSVLSGFIETLQGPAKDDENAREKFLNLMAEQTSRMTQLVQDLLALSKTQMTQKEKRADIIPVADLLKSVIDTLSLKATSNHKTLELKMVHDIPRLIGNKNDLVHVFQNLIDNAIKYGEPNSTITISAKLCTGFPKKSEKYFSDMRQVVLISVNNKGPVIEPKNLARLFERFYRVDSIKTRSIEGTGLGLGIAQQIINEHEGLIDVQSTQKHGTTFNVYLPIDL